MPIKPKKPKKPKETPDKEILKTFQASGLVEYMEYLQSPRRILLTNFNAGIAKGLGLTIGMSIILGVAAWVLTIMVQLPVIGEWAQAAEDYMDAYQESTNYSDDFRKMNALLEQINSNIQGEGISSLTTQDTTEARPKEPNSTESKLDED